MNMKTLFTRYLKNDPAEQAAWFLVWFSLPFSLKFAGASIILAAMVILVSFIRRPFVPDRRKVLYLLPPVILFAWYAKELFTAQPLLPAWKETEKLLSLFILPSLFALSRIRKEPFTKAALAGFIPALLICSLVMLAAAVTRFSASGDAAEFTYHKLASPFHTGAIYFSFYLLFALFKLDDPAWWPDRNGVKVAMGIFFLLMLLLLASKLLIGVGIPLLMWHHRRFIVSLWKKRKGLVVFLLLLVALGSLPFLERLQVLMHPNLDMVRSVNFKNEPEPNGLSLRLIFWRFGKEILDEQHAWFSGAGMSRSQELLNQKFYQYHLYTGYKEGPDTGYLNYNFHNQFVETLVRTGIPGLFFLMLILVIFAIQPRETLFAPRVFIWLITAFFLTESVLERQAGVVIFCLIYATFFYSDDFRTTKNRSQRDREIAPQR
jgi:O-antigen ligase